MSKAVERAMDVLYFVGNSEHCPTMSNICKELGIPKASASELIHTLLERRFLRIQDSERQTFALGESVFQLGNAYRRQTKSLQVIHEEAKTLAKCMERTVFFWMCQENRMVLMDRVLSRSGVYPNYDVGHSEPMEGLIGGVYREGAWKSEAMAGGEVCCYGVPIYDAEGRKAGVLSAYALCNVRTEEGQQILLALSACAEKIAKKIVVES